MTTAANIDLSFLSRELELPVDQVQRTLQLLDDGNTIPFITRYRKEHTGGLNEEQILAIQQEALKLRLLAERKQTILRSVESQGKLTPELATKITSARTLKWLEDVYLPYKPKKQTLATIARHRGLEPLAKEILEANPAANDLQARGAACLAPDNGLKSIEDVLQGVGHILAEMFSERADVRGRLRKALRRDGVLTCTRIDPAERTPSPPVAIGPSASGPSGGEVSDGDRSDGDRSDLEISVTEHLLAAEQPSDHESDSTEAETNAATAPPASPDTTLPAPRAAESEPTTAVLANSPASAEPQAENHAAENLPLATAEEVHPAINTVAGTRAPKPPGPLAAQVTAKKTPTKKQLAKERKKKLLEHAFKDYYNFREALSRLPPHRILAINRGERAKVLRVRVDYNAEGLIDEATHHMVPDGHIHLTYLRACARDALQRLVLPSLERELRRELAEEAEQHALQVFIRNLRKLLLQPPVRGKRVLAVDPGFRSGCKLAAVDAFGGVLEHGMINLVGSDEQRNHARATLGAVIRRHRLELVAIGNGAGCRAAEQIVSDVIGSELSGTPIAYLIVNEAGASVYSTSQVGRDELPHCDPMMRSAVSIGRRLQDPLSELVKINPANIGVGMYQHDMKAKYLRESLDSVVNLCVNFVGVELNSASPSLLGYVSGLNQLTARRVYEYRQQHGPFRNREQLKEVPGIGEATFVQAAGFLRIPDGDNPLDGTWIHPESYEVARRVLERLNIPLSDLSPRGTADPRLNAQSAGAATLPAPPPATEPTTCESTLNSTAAAAQDPPATEPATTPLAETLPAAVESTPAESTPAESTPAESTPAESTPAESTPAESAPAEPAATEPAATNPTVSELTATNLAEPNPTATESSASDGTGTAAPATEPAGTTPPLSTSLAERLANVPIEEMSRELGIGELLLEDILSALSKPGRDPRDDFSPPPFRTGIMKLDDLKPGMELQGTVLNVVDFGAFVDIGISDSALIHISKLADQFIRDPQEVISVGDFLKVWVIEVDKERRRVSLTAIDPSAARRPRERREGKPRRYKPRQQSSSAPPTAAAPPAARRPPPAHQRQPQRPPRPASKKPPPKFANRTSGPPPKPKPVRPITKAMLTGQQPMRSFSDLVQFYEKKQQDPDEKK